MEDEHEPASKKRKCTNEGDLLEAESTNLEEIVREVKLPDSSIENCEDLAEDAITEGINGSSKVRPIETSPKDGTVIESSKKEFANNDQERLTEHDVGINEYISTFPGIPGVLKQRYSDFVVWEIDAAGEMVKLDSIGEKEMVENSKDDEVQKKEPENEEAECPLSEEELAKLNEFVLKPKEEDPTNNNLILNGSKDKECRKQMHFYIKKNYANLDTETVDGANDEKMIKVLFKNPNQKGRRWEKKPKNKSKFCHFVLYKENKDTMSAVNFIADLLHVRPLIFTYAGTKDKRAITVQKICAKGLDTRKLASLNKRVRNMAVGCFENKDDSLKLGDLSGNHFSLVLRDIPFDTNETTASQIMQSLKENGFINYFGMQRFGSGSVPTFEIGKAVMASKWEETINLILTPREGEEESIQKAKELWMETKDSKAAFEMSKRRRCIESQVLEVLSQQGEKAFYNAFQKIARNARLMYVHSYQSYVWNRIVSKRIKMFGTEPKIGDLVISKTPDKDGQGKKQAVSLTWCKVQEITQEDIDQGIYTITDVVMPLPGYDIIYPGGQIKQWYSELLIEDGFDIDNMKHEIKDYSLSGAYRHIMVKPGDIKHTITTYDDFCIPLIQTDLDVINGKEPPGIDMNGKYKALKVEFTLPPSSYATMVVREITKLDTSTSQNMKLNKV